jgi:dTDP-4-dehydrorhamnose reductase
MQGEIEKSKKADGFVDALLFTQFCDKGDIIRKSLRFSCSATALKRKFWELQKLRDHLAHANDYAGTPAEAKHVCALVRVLLALRTEIANASPKRVWSVGVT